VELEKRANMNLLSKRFFTVKTIEHMESFTLNFVDIDLMKKDFKQYAHIFIKEQIKQSMHILKNLYHLSLPLKQRLYQT